MELHRRLDRIYVQWQRVWNRRLLNSYLSLPTVALMVAICSTIWLMSLDLVWRGQRSVSPQIPVASGPLRASILLLSLILQVWYVEMRLGWITLQPWTLRPVVLWLRRILSVVPVAGLSLVPAWDVLLRERPPWAFNKTCTPPGLRSDWSARPVRISRWLSCLVNPRLLLSTSGFLGLGVLNSAAMIMWADWLAFSDFSSRDAQMIAGSLFYHGCGFAATAHCCWRSSRDSASLAAQASPLLSLTFLVPYPAVGLLSLLGFTVMRRHSATLSIQTLEPVPRWLRSFDTGRPAPRWTLLREKLRSSWEGQPWWRRVVGRRVKLDARAAMMTKSAGRVFLFARLKILLLYPEGVAVSSGILYFELPSLALLLIFLAPLVLGSITAMIAVFRFLRRLTVALQRRPPYSRYMAAGQFTLFAGVLAGFTLTDRPEGEPFYTDAVTAPFYILLSYVAVWLALLVCSEILFKVFLVPAGYRGQGSAMWNGGWFLIAAIGSLGMRDDVLEIFYICIVVVVALEIGLGFGLYRWVLRPRKLRDLLDRNEPFWTHVQVAFLATTALLPLGGLAVPIWFYLRRDALEGSD